MNCPSWESIILRVQILTIADLLEGKWIEFPEPANATLKKRQSRKLQKNRERLLIELMKLNRTGE